MINALIIKMLQRLNEILALKALKEKNPATDIDSIDIANVLTANNCQNVAALLAAEKSSYDRLRISESKSDSINKERSNNLTSYQTFDDSYRNCHEISSKGGDHTIRKLYFVRNGNESAQCCISGYSSSMSDSSSSCFSVSQNKTNVHIAEEELRAKARNRTIFDIFRDFKCPTTCVLGQDCKSPLTLKAITEEIDLFWGDSDIQLSTTQRRKAIVKKLFAAYQRNDQNEYFAFSVGKTIGSRFRVCEATYFQIVGRNKTTMWRNSEKLVKTVMKNGDMSIVNNTSLVEDMLKLRKRKRRP